MAVFGCQIGLSLFQVDSVVVCLWIAKVVFCVGSSSVVVGCCTLCRLFRSFKSCFSLFPIFKLTLVVQLVSFSEDFFYFVLCGFRCFFWWCWIVLDCFGIFHVANI